MQIVIVKDYHEMSKKAADIFVNFIRSKPNAVLGLPTGDTPLFFYREVVAAYKKKDVNLSDVRTFNLDEYVGLPPDSRSNYAFYMYSNLLSRVNVKDGAAMVPDGAASDLEAECERYENAIESAGGLDFTLLGIGANGHIGFNEPGTAFSSECHVARLARETIDSNLRHFGDRDKVPNHAITMGLKTIMGSQKIILMASGPHKARAMYELVEGPITQKFPASVLQTHDDVTVIIDEAAASELKKAGYTDQSVSDFTIYHGHTLPENRSIVVISPHPDDSSISAGGTIGMLADKNNVTILVMTSGYRAWIPKLDKKMKIRKRRGEAIEEAKILGVKVRHLDLDFYETKKIMPSDIKKMYAVLKKLDPDIVFLSSVGDPHPTHKMSTEISLSAIRKVVGKKKRVIELWQYESPWALFQPGAFNAVVQLPARTVKRKLKAVKKHRSQIKRTPFDKVSEAMAIIRGAVVPEQVLGTYGQVPPKLESHAEVFYVSRIVYGKKLVESLSGVRGIYGIGLNDEVAEAYAYAYGSWLRDKLSINPRIVIGRDSRPTGRILEEAMIKGLEKANCHVLRVGIGTTPLIQFEVRNKKSHGGIIVTASHNEPDWNGFKFLWRDGGILSPNYMDEVKEKYRREEAGGGKASSEHYVKFVMNTLGKAAVENIRNAGLRIVVDPNGGAMIVLIKKLFEHMNIETVELNMDLGVFKHRVEPTKEALKHMGPIIKETKSDLGVAWDCDGDRVEIILPSGRNISGHYILALLVDDVFSRRVKHKIVVVSNATSQVVNRIAAKYGAKVVETDVGEANVVEKMYKVQAPVGGEGTCGGGVIPPSRCRDGVLTLFKILSMIVGRNKSLPLILKDYPSFYTLQKNVKVLNFDKLQRKIEKYYKNQKIKRLGGKNGSIKIWLSNDSFVHFRPSKTEPDILRIVSDSPSRHISKQIMDEAISLVG